MSSLEEFHEEAEILTAPSAPPLQKEKLVLPVTVPHTRPRDKWGEWADSYTFPPDVLDYLVNRLDSNSWSTTGGKCMKMSQASISGREKSYSSAAARPSPVVAKNSAAVSNVGGATSSMRGVSGAAERRLLTSGRARALRRRSAAAETPQTREARKPREARVVPPSRGRAGGSKTPVKFNNKGLSFPPVRPSHPPYPSLPPHPLRSNTTVTQSKQIYRAPRNWGNPREHSCPVLGLNAAQSGGGPCSKEESVWEEQRGPKDSENGRKNGQEQRVIEARDVTAIVKEEEEVSDHSSCFFSANETQEGESAEETERNKEKELTGVLICQKKQVGGKESPGDRDHYEENNNTSSTRRKLEVAGKTTHIPLRIDQCREDATGWEGTDGALDSVGGGSGRVGGAARMESDCLVDRLETLSAADGQVDGLCTGAYGGSSEPKLPVWVHAGHTLILNNIPATISEEELEGDIESFGEVTNLSILAEPNNVGLHTAYVRMKERESCQWVISCFHGIPYANGGTEPMVCRLLHQQVSSSTLGLWDMTM